MNTVDVNQEYYISFYKNRINLAVEMSAGRNIWIFGAGKGGSLLLRLLIDAGVKVEGFVDRRFDKIDECEGLPVKQIKYVNAKTDFLLLSPFSVDTTMLDDCKKNGFLSSCYFL